MGSVYSRKGSKKLWLKYYQNGRVVRETTETTNVSEARRMLRVREGAVERGVPIDAKVGRITFDEAVTDLLNDYLANGKRTYGDTKRRIEKHLQPFFGNPRLNSISTSDVRAFVAKRQLEGQPVRRRKGAASSAGGIGEGQAERRKVSAGEINRELTVLKRMFSLAVQAGKLHHKPHIPMLREDNVRVGFFEWSQYVCVLNHLPEAMRPVVTFAYVTGWRINSEVLPLEWRQVDLEAGEVRLDPGTTKNREGRIFHLTPELTQVLEDQRELADGLQRELGMIARHVFFHSLTRKDGKISTRAGEAIKGSGFYHAWCRARRAAGCPASIPHDFRRTAIRNMVRAGVPERVAMKLSGHKTRSVFDRYNVVSDGDLREASERLGHSFGHSSPVAATQAKRNPQNS